MSNTKQGQGKPFLPNIPPYIQAGIDPKTKLPLKLESAPNELLCGMNTILQNLDKQDAVNRYKWYNLPSNLTGTLLERILYYRGQGMFFYSSTDDTFYFLPYTLDGTIDIYGRYKQVKAMTFGGGTDDKDIDTIFSRVPVYGYDDIDLASPTDSCVLLSDYSKGISQTIIPRSQLQQPLLTAMAEAYPLCRTSLISHSGVKGMRVNDDDEATSVTRASNAVTNAALSGKPWIPITSRVEFQDLTSDSALNSEEYLLYMQSLDNFRLSLYGLDSGGIFEKKSHTLAAEQAMNVSTSSIIYQDGLSLRQQFCDLVNAIWGLGIWCEASETVQGDTNGDGVAQDNTMGQEQQVTSQNSNTTEEDNGNE